MPVWKNGVKHIFTGSVQQACRSHIFANFSSFLEVQWLYNNVQGATVAESENVFPGGDALS